jgi:hypothetical protein
MTPLRRRMIEDMQIRNLALNTQETYVEQVERFARHFRRSPERLGPPEIRAWQLYLAQDRHLAASSISVAVAALRFLYTVTLRRPWNVSDDIPHGRQSKSLPDVLSPEEVAVSWWWWIASPGPSPASVGIRHDPVPGFQPLGNDAPARLGWDPCAEPGHATVERKPGGQQPLIAITRRLDWRGKGSRMDLSVAGQMGAGPSDGAPENSATA